MLAYKETEGGNGSWGKSSSEVKWLETGPGVWGVITEGGFSQGGAMEGSTQILHDDGKEIYATLIPTLSDNTGIEDCDDKEFLKIAEKSQAECYANQTDLKATIEVRHDLSAVGNTYPVQVTVNGYEGMKLAGKGKNTKAQSVKEYKDKKYLFSYDANKHEYVMPADYPKSLDFWGNTEGKK